MNIVVITSGSFPFGEAGTNRLLSWARGLVELGHDVNIILLYPSKQHSDSRNRVKGQINGIKYKYASLITKWPKNEFLKHSTFFKGVLYGLIELSRLYKEKKTDAIIILEYYPIRIIPFILFAKINNIKVLHEFTEYPFLNQRSTIIKRIRLNIYLKWAIKRYDGVFLITTALKKYYLNYIRKEKHVAVIPMIVEPDRFLNCSNKTTFKFPYIAYCGSMYTEKDGLLILIEAFNLVLEQFPDYHLLLIGDNSNKEKFNYIIKKINNLDLSRKIHFTGRVSRDEMPALLCNASLLALSRPDNIQARGGFPTKLGEYLATGIPVVVTEVGEIPLYLRDGENAFLAKPDDPTAFAGKIIEALDNYKRALNIGKNGQKLTYEIFNYKVQTKRIVEFIDEISL